MMSVVMSVQCSWFVGENYQFRVARVDCMSLHNELAITVCVCVASMTVCVCVCV